MSDGKMSWIPDVIIAIIKNYDLKINHIIGIVIIVALYFGNPTREEHEGYVRNYLEKSGASSTVIFYRNWYLFSVVYTPPFGCFGRVTLNLSNAIISCTSTPNATKIEYKNMQPLTYGILWKIFETDAFILIQHSSANDR
jgi:hypothetical protein